jgi:CRISPR/Cas system CMR-associated protein Cmr5 small subunit
MTARRIDLDLAAMAEQTLRDVQASLPTGVPAEVFSRMRGLPVMLRVSGVPATLAFYAAKSNPGTPTGRAYQKVSEALHRQVADTLGATREPLGLCQALRETPNPSLLRAFSRLEAYAEWLRRLAEALNHDQERDRRRNAAASAVGSDGG